MTMRTRQTTITFRRVARIDGLPEPLPAGEYDFDTDEEQISGLSFSAYRRVQTTITVPANTRSRAGRQVIVIEPEALQAALDRDAKEPSALDET